MRPACVVDTHVLVAAPLTSDAQAPTARLVDGMLDGAVRFILSVDPLAAAPGACLVTGDRALLEGAPAGFSVLSPQAYLALPVGH